jgi:streptogramin lyase
MFSLEYKTVASMRGACFSKYARLVPVYLLVLTACSGGGLATSEVHPGNVVAAAPSNVAAQPLNANQTTPVPVSIMYRLGVNRSTSSALIRKPEYISTSNTQITVKVTPLGGSSTSYGPTACTTASCTVNFTAIPGPNVLNFTLTDGTNTLANFTTTQIVQPSGLNTFNLTANPVVDHVALALASSTENSGTPVDDLLTVNAFDIDNDLIVGSGHYVDSNGNALTLSLSTSTNQAGGLGRVSIKGATELSASNQAAIYAHYDGNWLSDATISIASSSALVTNLTPTTLTSNPGLQQYATSGGPDDVVTGPDGNLWFVDNTANMVGRLTLSGTVTEYPCGTHPSSITVGPDGNVWFTETSANQIGKITTAGVLTEYPVPTAGSTPDEITVGPDGNLWFVETGTNAVAKVTTNGKFVEYTVPSSGSAPSGIASGPDGGLWFTENSSNKIGRISTDGKFTEFAISVPGSGPYHITKGPDGNMWFTEKNANNIARITTQGAITEYFVPTGGVQPDSMTSGPDGNLWFTENNKNFGRITPNGVITEYPLIALNGSGLKGITFGPDGNLWFTEHVIKRISRFIL